MDRNDIREGFVVGCLSGLLLAGIVVMAMIWFGT